jgi:hypothetical protein
VKTLADIASQIAGLFVEDRAFAIAIATVIAVVGVLAVAHVVPPALGGFVLFAGLAIEFVASVLLATTRA